MQGTSRTCTHARPSTTQCSSPNGSGRLNGFKGLSSGIQVFLSIDHYTRFLQLVPLHDKTAYPLWSSCLPSYIQRSRVLLRWVMILSQEPEYESLLYRIPPTVKWGNGMQQPSRKGCLRDPCPTVGLTVANQSTLPSTVPSENRLCTS